MAKSKKTTKKSADKPANPAASPTPALPSIDTAHAAQAAAALVAGGVNPSHSTDATNKESAAFRNLKQSLNKPASTGSSNLLDKSAANAARRTSGNANFGPQRGRNQTFGADVNRTGVPRRTGG